MTIWKAALLGVVQGITSILPVGSSGHIALFARLLGESSAGSLRFMVFLHIGTLFAVVWTFRKDLVKILESLEGILRGLFFNLVIFLSTLFHPEKRKLRPLIRGNYDRFLILLFVSMLPSAVISAAVHRLAYTGAVNLLLTAMGFFVTALLLLISSYTITTRKNPAMTRCKDALMIGIFQGFSALPGISRAGMAWSASSLCGFTPGYRFRYACLLSIPSIIGGMIYVLPDGQAAAEQAAGIPACIAGVLTAAVVSYIVLNKLKRFLARTHGRGFAVYTLLAGIVCIVASFR